MTQRTAYNESDPRANGYTPAKLLDLNDVEAPHHDRLAKMRAEFLALQDRFGYHGTNPATSEGHVTADNRPGVSVEAGSVPFVRMVFTDPYNTNVVWIDAYSVGKALAHLARLDFFRWMPAMCEVWEMRQFNPKPLTGL